MRQKIAGLRTYNLQPTTAVNDPFGRYGPMDKHEVRSQKVEGDERTRIEQTRKMLRSMTAEKLLEVIEFRQDLNLFEALALAQREGKMIVPNDIHDKILAEAKDEELLKQLYGNLAWTGTLIIYEKPDKKFGKTATFSWEDNDVIHSVSFKVPKQFRGKKNCALVIEHPDFEIIELGKNRHELKVDEQHVHQIESFPKKEGWYKPHQQLKIPQALSAGQKNTDNREMRNISRDLPERQTEIDEISKFHQGEPVEESKEARSLWRLDSAYIGSVGRGVYDFYFYDWRGVYASYWWSYGSGVAFVSLGREATR